MPQNAAELIVSVFQVEGAIYKDFVYEDFVSTSAKYCSTLEVLKFLDLLITHIMIMIYSHSPSGRKIT